MNKCEKCRYRKPYCGTCVGGSNFNPEMTENQFTHIAELHRMLHERGKRIVELESKVKELEENLERWKRRCIKGYWE